MPHHPRLAQRTTRALQAPLPPVAPTKTAVTEIDLRAMMDGADAFEPDEIEGRYVIQTRHRRDDWHIIVEPDEEDHLLVVVTAFPV